MSWCHQRRVSPSVWLLLLLRQVSLSPLVPPVSLG